MVRVTEHCHPPFCCLETTPDLADIIARNNTHHITCALALVVLSLCWRRLVKVVHCSF